mgnify:CR=1 FL=1
MRDLFLWKFLVEPGVIVKDRAENLHQGPLLAVVKAHDEAEARAVLYQFCSDEGVTELWFEGVTPSKIAINKPGFVAWSS